MKCLTLHQDLLIKIEMDLLWEKELELLYWK
jgi:3-oxoacyl-[acyl-carrier-protein] synthase II